MRLNPIVESKVSNSLKVPQQDTCKLRENGMQIYSMLSTSDPNIRLKMLPKYTFLKHEQNVSSASASFCNVDQVSALPANSENFLWKSTTCLFLQYSKETARRCNEIPIALLDRKSTRLNSSHL